MKKVSVIVPAYNTENYLAECLLSIEKQTIGLENLEVILVNDGSNDKTLTIMKKFQKKHPEWQIIDRSNKGLSVSRNDGMNKATGMYLTFLDSDDYLDPKALKEMYDTAVKNSSDVVIARLNGFDTKKKYGYYSDKYICKYQSFNYHTNPRILKVVSSCSKLYKNDLVANIRFIPGIKHEDNYFALMVYNKAKKITTIPEYLYFRRYREGEKDSITQNLSLNSYNDLIINYQTFFKEFGIDKNALRFSLRYFNNYIIGSLEKKDKLIAQKNTLRYLQELKQIKIINCFNYYFYIIYNKIYYLLASIYYKIRHHRR